MRISGNDGSMQAINRLNRNRKLLNAKLCKLSSGLRINGAADDAAGLAISEKMRALIRGLGQASRNIQDGISYLDTADSYLGEIQSPPLQRLRELAVAAANDTYNSNDRKLIQEEVEAIKDHLRQVFRSAEFNTHKIFAQDIKRIRTPIPGVLPGDTIIRQYGLQVVAGKNDIFSFRLDDQPYNITLSAGSYSASQLVEALNTKFADAGTDLTVQFERDSLVFKSPTKVFDGFGDNMIEINSPLAYTSIIYDNSKPGFIQGTSIIGKEDISDGVIIDNLHTTLSFRVGNNGTYKNAAITLAEGSYTQQQLIDTLNAYFTTKDIDVTASIDAATHALLIQHDICGAGYTIDQLSGTAKGVILDRVYTTTTEAYVYGGSNGYPARFSGYKNIIAGVTIQAGLNDSLRLMVDGTAHSFTLAPGTYDATGIINHLNSLFSSNVPPLPITAQLNGANLQLVHDPAASASVGAVSGMGAYELFGAGGQSSIESPGTFYFVEGNSTPQPGNHAAVTGRTSLTNGVQVISGFNDTLTFNLDGNAQ